MCRRTGTNRRGSRGNGLEPERDCIGSAAPIGGELVELVPIGAGTGVQSSVRAMLRL
jgi:hypothetical protein